MNFGIKIAELRNKNHITQEELANMIHVSRDLISKWENNKRRPDYQTLHNLENIFNVETNYFEPPNRALTDELAKCVP